MYGWLTPSTPTACSGTSATRGRPSVADLAEALRLGVPWSRPGLPWMDDPPDSGDPWGSQDQTLHGFLHGIIVMKDRIKTLKKIYAHVVYQTDIFCSEMFLFLTISLFRNRTSDMSWRDLVFFFLHRTFPRCGISRRGVKRPRDAYGLAMGLLVDSGGWSWRTAGELVVFVDHLAGWQVVWLVVTGCHLDYFPMNILGIH